MSQLLGKFIHAQEKIIAIAQKNPKHANDALGCLYELEANCQFNNLTISMF